VSPRSEALSRIGQVIAGTYRLNRLLGVGRVGAVYAAVHLSTDEHVALKLLDPAQGGPEGAGPLREARAAAAVGHPAICEVLDAGQEPDGRSYLVLELLEGRDLRRAIEAEDLRLGEIVEIGVQLLDGLAAAHDAGIVHRDIKPENVFLAYDASGRLRVKLLDFGNAPDPGAGPVIVDEAPWTMSPEQIRGGEVDARSDLWSTGAVLFWALTGRPPFEAPNPPDLAFRILQEEAPALREVGPDLPEWLAPVVDGALVRDPDERWQAARTMAEALRLRGGAPVGLDWEGDTAKTARVPPTLAPIAEPPPPPRRGEALPTMVPAPSQSSSTNLMLGMLIGALLAALVIVGALLATRALTAPTAPTPPSSTADPRG
jgi:serine/threonine protein kinase